MQLSTNWMARLKESFHLIKRMKASRKMENQQTITPNEVEVKESDYQMGGNIAAMAEALALAQSEIKTIVKDATVTGKTFSYKYATLAQVTEAVFPILSKH